MKEYINEDDDELATKDIRSMVRRVYKVKVSTSTIRRILREELEWVVTGPKYCQALQEANKQKRLDFCQKLLDDNDKFEDVVWTDESSVEVTRHKKLCRRRPRKLKPKPKHPLKAHVWAGISMKGATEICVFFDIMDAEVYVCQDP